MTLKLWLCNLDGDHGCQTFAEVIAGNLNFGFFQKFVVLGIFLQCACQCTAKAFQVLSTFHGVDIVNIGVDILVVACVVHDGHIDRSSLSLSSDIDNLVKQMFTVGIHITNELTQSVFGVEGICLERTIFQHMATVGQCDGNACIQECQFTHTLC